MFYCSCVDCGALGAHTSPVEPAILAPSIPIKEGMVEKRGHSAKFLMFSRYVCVYKDMVPSIAQL